MNCLEDALQAFRRSQYVPGAGLRLIGNCADYAFTREVKVILEDWSDRVTWEDTVSRLSDILPALTEKWADQRKNEFATLATHALEDAGLVPGTDPLTLAVTMFQCKKCTCSPARLRWPAVVKHDCIRTYKVPHKAAYHRAITIYHARSWHDRSQQLFADPGQAVFMRDTLRYAREVVTACGLDPNKATKDDMDACEVRLRCRLCATLDKQEVFHWEGAVSTYLPLIWFTMLIGITTSASIDCT